MSDNFSVLISVYCTEVPSYLDRSLKSIWSDQILKPSQIVLIKDGPLTAELDVVIDEWKYKLGDVMDVFALNSNVGLGNALRFGISNCKYELIARMDTDDISLADRFRVQVDFLSKNFDIDIVGSNIGEFETNDKFINSIRLVPDTHKEIVRISKIKNPFNHPTVMYKKSSVMAAGGPKKMTGFDDWYLWCRMIMNGSKCANIPEILVKCRIGNGLMDRRGGLSYLVLEYKFLKSLLDMKYINILEFIRNILIRLPVRLLPNRLRGYFYKLTRG